HYCLSGRDRSLRLFKTTDDLVLSYLLHRTPGAFMVIAYLGKYPLRFRQVFHGHKVYAVCAYGMSQRFFIGTDDYLIGIGPDLKDKRWVPQSQTKTLALAHRIMDDSFVSAQHFSVRRHEVSCGKILSRLLPH